MPIRFTCHTIISTLLFCLAATPNHVFSQSPPTLPAYYPIAEHTYDIKDGLPDVQVENVFMDKAGRLHIETRVGVGTAFGEPFYVYDGTRTYPAGIEISGNPHGIHLEGKDSLGRFYGFATFMETKHSVVFWYDLMTKSTQGYEIDKWVVGVISADGALFALAAPYQSNLIEILHIQGDNISSLHQLEIGSTSLTLASLALAITDDAFWVGESSRLIYRVNRKDGKVKHFSLPGEEKWLRQVLVSPNNDVWINTSSDYEKGLKKNSIAVYRWDHKTSSFITNPHKPAAWKDSELSYAMAFKDAKGNILVSYRNKNQEASATLVDVQGELFDYTEVMGNLELASGDDFKQGIIFHLPGLQFVEVALRNAVKKNTSVKNPRQMLELDSRTIFRGGAIVLSYSNGAWETKDTVIPCMSMVTTETQDISKDDNGHIWFEERFLGPPVEYRLMRYRPEQGLCDTFDFGGYNFVFDFKGDGQMVQALGGNVYLWDKQSRAPKPIAKQAYKGVVNQLLAGKEGYAWLATGKGLLKIDLLSGTKEWVDLIPGKTVNVMRIHQDKKGRLWLGTVMNGVVIYDPASGKIQVIDQTNGLSNNIVVTLLEDDDGDIWAGTFLGITVLSPQGEVLGALYEKDGLANNECNRWSALKMKDGRLCFGSVSGVSIIDPALWKTNMKGHSKPTIYLTELYSDAHGQSIKRTDHFDLFEQNKRIVLPAANRNLKLGFGLSNYSSPEKNTFAYQIEGKDGEWHYIGAQRKLSINSLPAGSYNILIKGSDGRGQWSDPPIVIPVSVSEYFYKKWWFFMLCAVPFVAFFLIYRNRKQGERKRLETEVQHRTATIQEQSEKLQELDQAKNRLYTNITHEFRTPLTVIMGIAEQMKAEIGKLEIEKLENGMVQLSEFPNFQFPISLIERNSGSLLSLVNQMLDLRKLESGAMPLHLAQDNLVRFLRYTAESFRSLADEKSIQFHFLTDEESLLMDFDAEKMRQVVVNLLSNAIKFTPEGGNIYLHLDKTGDENAQYAVIKVRDTGIGISEEKLPRIFEQFYQVDDSSTRQGEGTGIGLTLASELVNRMDGEISVTSQPGKGSTFTVKLLVRNEAPLASDPTYSAPTPTISDLDVAMQHPLPMLMEEDEGTKSNKPTVLIVEDNADVVHYLVLCLKDQYDLKIAMDGQEGINAAIETVPDLIVSDVMMPEKDGFELCETLKQDERTSHIPIVLLTAKADAESRVMGLQRGADAYLSKPFSKPELFARMEQLIALRKRLQQRYQSLESLPPTEEPQV